MMSHRFSLAALALLLALSPVSLAQPQTQPATAPATQPQAAWIREAPLPQGWPDPTPVGEVREKTLPAYRVAYADMNQGDRSRGAFGRLFRHIKQADIAMTTPVRMDMTIPPGDAEPGQRPTATRMGFLYREAAWGDLGEFEGNVVVKDEPAIRIVSTGIRGTVTAAQFDQAVQRLEAYVANRKDLEPAGGIMQMGYNSPFIVEAARYTEIALPVRDPHAAQPATQPVKP